jgi:hypothetical protein
MTDTAPEVLRVAWEYFEAWQDKAWDRLRATLADGVELFDPRVGSVLGVDAHVALYVDGTRFPDLTGVALRRFVNSADVAIVSYDAYLGTARKATVFDQITVRDGKVTEVFTVQVEWPPERLAADSGR